MPRYLSITTARSTLAPFIHSLSAPKPSNPLMAIPSPHDYFASLPADRIPPNVRIQDWVEDRKRWEGVGEVERMGGRKTKDWGKEWRRGKGREARAKGGLKWALRER